jgi:hypothetical protein
VSGLTHKEIIARLEASGEMDRRREVLKKWFADHPHGTPVDAVDAHPEWTLADHMHVVADSVFMDLRASGLGAPHVPPGGMARCADVL